MVAVFIPCALITVIGGHSIQIRRLQLAPSREAGRPPERATTVLYIRPFDADEFIQRSVSEVSAESEGNPREQAIANEFSLVRVIIRLAEAGAELGLASFASPH